MRIACFYLPQFAVQVERQRAPALQDRPVVIGGYHHESGHVHSVSEEAAAYGVTPDAGTARVTQVDGLWHSLRISALSLNLSLLSMSCLACATNEMDSALSGR